MIDIELARKQTPGCHTHIHFNNAGASLMPSCVIDTVSHHFDLETALGGYEAASLVSERANRFYSSCSELLHCQSSEIAYIENATRAWDMVFYGLEFHAGDKILTGKAEYASNYIAFLQMAKKKAL